MKKNVIYVFVFILSLTSMLSGCSNNKEKSNDLHEIDVLLDWDINTNHTGLYVADALGYFADEGLKVNFIQAGDSSTADLVGNNHAPFGISYQEDVTLARSSDTPLPVKAIATINQHNTTGFGVAKGRGIESVRDFSGKTYGSYGGGLIEEKILEYVVTNAGGNYEDINIVNSQMTDFFQSLDNGIDFTWVFEGWDIVVAKEKGVDVDYFPLRDYGIDYYTPVIITSDLFIEQDTSGIVTKFLRATTKGYEYAVENSLEAANILVSAAPSLDKKLIEKSQAFLSSQYMADTDRWGVMKTEVWQNFSDFLYENDIILQPLDVESAFTNEFLPE